MGALFFFVVSDRFRLIIPPILGNPDDPEDDQKHAAVPHPLPLLVDAVAEHHCADHDQDNRCQDRENQPDDPLQDFDEGLHTLRMMPHPAVIAIALMRSAAP